MATSIEGNVKLLSLGTKAEVVGIHGYKEPGSALFTIDNRTAVVVKVADNQPLLSYTLKGGYKFSQPVVYDFAEDKFVGLVTHLKKHRLCTWSADQLDNNEWKKITVLDEIKSLVQVEGSEPLLIRCDGCVCWLSQVDHPYPDKLTIPEGFTLSSAKCVTSGANIHTLIYQVCNGKESQSQLYSMEYKGKHLNGSALHIHSSNFSSFFTSPHEKHSVYILEDRSSIGRVDLKVGGESVMIHKSQTGIDILSIAFLDEDQMVLATHSEDADKLMLFSKRFGKVTELTGLTTNISDSHSIQIFSPHILTVHESEIQAHLYKFGKLTLRSMLNKTRHGDMEADEDRITKCVAAMTGNKSITTESLQKDYKEQEVLGAVAKLADPSYYNIKKWPSDGLVKVVTSYTLPSEGLEALIRNAQKHYDKNLIDAICGLSHMDEVVIVQLLKIAISMGKSETNSEDSEDAIQTVNDNCTRILRKLLSRNITDVFAIKAMRTMPFDDALILLQYLCTQLQNLCHDHDAPLPREQAARWCAVILDAHNTHLILSNQAKLLIELHEHTLQQIELQSNFMKLGTQLFAKAAKRQPSKKPYCIEVVTFRYP